MIDLNQEQAEFNDGQIVLVSYPDGMRQAYGVFADTEAAGEWVAANDFIGAETEPVQFFDVSDDQ